jgi:sarcosine oxidase subunit beta
MANPATADVIIVGAGIMGVSTAYHLARRRAGRIVVLERDDVCSGSTALASGGIRHQYANRIGVELTRQSIETYERFADEFGVDPHFRQHGYLILISTEAEQAQAERNVALQRSLGVNVRLLTPDETRKRFPYLATDDLRGATYSPRDGYADPYLATTAIAARARELGVTIRTGCEVTGFTRVNDRVDGVVTRDGAVTAPVVVVATGAWSGVVGNSPDRYSGALRRWSSSPRRFRSTRSRRPHRSSSTRTWGSAAARGAGILLGIGRRAEAGSFSTVLDWSPAEPLVERAVRRAPVLEDASSCARGRASTR